ncbi:MAG: 2-hydroxyacyl-CoA dehydratase family protein [Chloroflexota bacterium]
MEDNLRHMWDVVDNPAKWLVGWKEVNKRRIIGCAPMFVPEEIVHAAGALPVVLWEGSEPITLAHNRIQLFFCGIARGIVDLVLKRELDFLDGIIIPDICLPMRYLPGVMQFNSAFPFQFVAYLPHDSRRPSAKPFLVEELGRLRSKLAEFMGVEISDDSLRRSIQVYNGHRALLRRLYELRRKNPGVLKAGEMMAVVASGMVMPKEGHSRLLAELLPELEARKPAMLEGPRLILSANLCEWPKQDILDLIEDLGGVVVDDEMYVGRRYFTTDADSASPIEGLADAYLNMAIPNPIAMDPTNRWGDYLLKMARDNQAQGVISLTVKYCEPHGLFYPDLAGKLSQAGIPHLMLEIEHEVVSWGQFKTRIQAFLETLRRKK